MQVTFTVTVDLEKESGKFVARDELVELLRESIEQADPGTVEGGPDGSSVYNVSTWDVEEMPSAPRGHVVWVVPRADAVWLFALLDWIVGKAKPSGRLAVRAAKVRDGLGVLAPGLGARR